MTRRTAVVCGATVALLMVAGSSPVWAQATCPFTVTGSLAPPDLTTSPRLFRDDPPNACGANQPCATSAGGPFQLDIYTLTTSPGPTPACVTVTLTTPCGGAPTFLHSGAFLGVFTASFLGDIGASPTANIPKSYSFNVAPATVFSVIVNEVTAGAGCPSYTLDVTGCNVTPVGVLDFSVNTP